MRMKPTSWLWEERLILYQILTNSSYWSIPKLKKYHKLWPGKVEHRQWNPSMEWSGKSGSSWFSMALSRLSTYLFFTKNSFPMTRNLSHLKLWSLVAFSNEENFVGKERWLFGSDFNGVCVSWFEGKDGPHDQWKCRAKAWDLNCIFCLVTWLTQTYS